MARRLRKRSNELRRRCAETHCRSALAGCLRTRYGETPAEALWRDVCGSAQARRRTCNGASYAEALWRDAYEALWRDAEALRRTRSGCDACVYGSAMARRLRKRSGETSAHTLWRDACGSAMTRRLRRRYGASYAEALWRDACGSALARRLRRRCEGDPCGSTLARCLRTRSGATPSGSAMARRLRKRSGETPAEALWRDACGSAVE